MNWKFWKHRRPPPSAELQQSRERLAETRRKREEMRQLTERHRQIRDRNHLAEAVLNNFRGDVL